jgi:hypothetical protein
VKTRLPELWCHAANCAALHPKRLQSRQNFGMDRCGQDAKKSRKLEREIKEAKNEIQGKVIGINSLLVKITTECFLMVCETNNAQYCILRVRLTSFKFL